MHPIRRLSLLAAMTGLAIGLLAPPVSAATYSRERYHDHETFSFTCGNGDRIDVESEFGGLLSIRAGTGKDEGAFFAHDRYWWRDVLTNSRTDTWIVLSGHGNFKETKAVRVEGSIFRFTSIDAGPGFVARDADGDLLARGTGVIRETIVFDTLGDDTPGGEFIESVDFRVSGPHDFGYDPCDDLT